METWQRLQARLFHLGYLGEELEGFVAHGPVSSAWLYRVIATEAGAVAQLAGDYIAACEHHHGVGHGGEVL